MFVKVSSITIYLRGLFTLLISDWTTIRYNIADKEMRSCETGPCVEQFTEQFVVVLIPIEGVKIEGGTLGIEDSPESSYLGMMLKTNSYI